MQKKLIFIGAGTLLVVAAAIFALSGSSGREGGFDLFMQAVDGEASATCMLSTGTDDSVTYHFRDGDVRTVRAGNIEDSGIRQEHNTLIKEGFVYMWSTSGEAPEVDSGTSYALSGSVREYLRLDTAEEVERWREIFERTGDSCRLGASDEMFETPDSVIFTDDAEIPASPNRT